MKIQEITTDLEISKELKENGFPQDSLYYYKFNIMNNLFYELRLSGVSQTIENFKAKDKRNPLFKDDFIYSAPTAEELLKELPQYIDNDEDFSLSINHTLTGKIYVNYDNHLDSFINDLRDVVTDKKLCNALALMWLYLKKNNLLEV